MNPIPDGLLLGVLRPSPAPANLALLARYPYRFCPQSFQKTSIGLASLGNPAYNDPEGFVSHLTLLPC